MGGLGLSGWMGVAGAVKATGGRISGHRRRGNVGGTSVQLAAGSRLLKAKLRAPATLDHYVRRARLHHLLDELVSAPGTLVVAPAGAGKTSLLSGWAAELTAPRCWLTLDEGDRDVAQLWSGVIGAVESRLPGCGQDAAQIIRRREGVHEAIVQLVADIESRLTTTTILIIDDLHVVDDDDAVMDSLSYFLKELPSSLRVVLASRRLPKLPLDRLRARGVLGEVHFKELRFSPSDRPRCSLTWSHPCPRTE